MRNRGGATPPRPGPQETGRPRRPLHWPGDRTPTARGAHLIPWERLGRADIPGGGQLTLSRRGEEYSIRIAGNVSELMNSRVHSSEEALSDYACELLPEAARQRASVLVGGLGMGFTLAAALRHLGPAARVTVAELVPGVVEWNRGALGECAGRPLDDPRVRVHLGDVQGAIRQAGASGGTLDALLLDVDNGPEAMTHPQNGSLYSAAGLMAAARALRPGGVLAVWSATPDEGFTRRLERSGLTVTVRTARARVGKGARHTIWLGQRSPEARG